MSNEKNLSCLGYIGDYTKQLNFGLSSTITRIPINQPVQWKVGGFFRGSCSMESIRECGK